MKQINPNTILRLFWHRTRRQFVPLTTVEIKRRSGLSDAATRGVLYSLVRSGQLYSYDTITYSNIYEATADGQAHITAAMVGEAS